MKPLFRALVLAAALVTMAQSARAAVLVLQAPTLAADGVAPATLGQSAALTESFHFEGTAQRLSWWGSAGGEFSLALAAAARPGQLLLDQVGPVDSEATGQEILLDGELLPIWRFSIALPDLPAGEYLFSFIERSADDLGTSWYALQASGGDGRSVSAFGEPGQVTQPFDLALQIDGLRVQTVSAPATASLLALAFALLSLLRLGRTGHPTGVQR